MKQKKYIYAFIEAIILAVLALLAFTVLNTEYLFGWVAHNWRFYLLLGTVALILAFLNKQLVSAYMTGGIIIGIFLGNFLGSVIKEINESKIVEGMKAEEVYRLKHHPGFEIWITIVFLSIVTGIIIMIIDVKKRRKG